MITALLERLVAWWDRRVGCFELVEALVIRDVRSGWLRMELDGSYRWHRTEREAMAG